ncbi:hypothetical protein JCM1841_003176 [Sporobolomyces salmonicolor]
MSDPYPTPPPFSQPGHPPSTNGGSPSNPHLPDYGFSAPIYGQPDFIRHDSGSSSELPHEYRSASTPLSGFSSTPSPYTYSSSAPTPSGSSAPFSSAAMLLEQHQMNQQAFRTTRQAHAHIFQNHAAGHPSGSTSVGEPASREGSASSSHGSELAVPTDGELTQTFYDPFRIKHRRRTSPPQLKVLEYHFDLNPKPDITLRKALSEQLDMTPREVQVWFQNRRAKVKKLREKAERETGNAAESRSSPPPAARTSPNALIAAGSELPVPPPFLPPYPSRTIYAQDVLASRRGDVPAIFGAGFPQPHPSAYDASLQPGLPHPYLAAPPAHLPFHPSAYPSPASLSILSSSGFSPAEQQQQQQPLPPLPLPPQLTREAAQAEYGTGRGFSLANPSRSVTLPYDEFLPPSDGRAPSLFPPSSPPFFDPFRGSGPPPPPPLQHPALDALGLPGDMPIDGYSPASSLGDLPWSDGSMDGPLPPQPPAAAARPYTSLDAPLLPLPLHPYSMARRASCPSDSLADQVSLGSTLASSSSWSTATPTSDALPQHHPYQHHHHPHQQQPQQQYQAAPPPPLYAAYPGERERRRSLALPLGTITEQPPAHRQPQPQPQQAQAQAPMFQFTGVADEERPPQPGGAGAGANAAERRRGAVARTVRTPHGPLLRSPYSNSAGRASPSPAGSGSGSGSPSSRA